MDITTFLVPTCPRTVYYIPNFITTSEERAILAAVQDAPKPKWEQLSNRRLLNYGGVPHANGMIAEKLPAWLQTYVDKVNCLGVFDKHRPNHVLVNEYLPGQGIMPHTDGPLFHPIISTISCGSHTVLEFTEKPPPTDEDTAKALLLAPAFTTAASPQQPASSSSYFAAQQRRPTFKLMVEACSLVIMLDDVYHRYLHSIAEREVDRITDDIQNLRQCCDERPYGQQVTRGKRVSLTIRHVPKTSKMQLGFGWK